MANIEVLSLSLKDVKAQIDALRASMVELDRDSAEYKVTAMQVVAAQQKLDQVLQDTNKNATAAEGSYNALQKELATLRTQWKATGDEARRAALGQQMAEVTAKLKDLDASVGVFNRNVGNYEIATKSLRAELAEGREELARLVQQYGLGDARVKALASSLAEMRDAVDDVNANIKQMASDTYQLDTAMDVMKTGVAGFGLIQGAMASLGIESEGTVKTIQKLQGTMLMLNSLTQIQTALTDRSSLTFRLLRPILEKVGLAKKVNVVATQQQNKEESKLTINETKAAGAAKVETVATQGLTKAKGGATIATKLFGNALKALPFVGIIAAIGTLIASLMDLDEWFGNSKESSGEAEEALLATANAAEIASNSVNNLIQQLYLKALIEKNQDAFAENALKRENARARLSKELLDNVQNAQEYWDKVKDRGAIYGADVVTKAYSNLAKAQKAYSDELAIAQEADEALKKNQQIVKSASDYLNSLTSATTASTSAKSANTTVTVKQNEALKESYNVLQKQLEALREEQGLRTWLLDWQYKMDVLRNNVNYLSEIKKENKELQQQKEIYEAEAKAIEAYIAAQKEIQKNATNEEDSKLAAANIAKAEADAKKTAIAIQKVRKNIELAGEKETLTEARFLLDNQIKDAESELKRSVSNISSMMKQGLKGIIPVVDLFDTDSNEGAMKVQKEIAEFYERIGNYSMAQNFWNQYFSSIEDAKIKNVVAEVQRINQEIYDSTQKWNGESLGEKDDAYVAEYISYRKQIMDYENTWWNEFNGFNSKMYASREERVKEFGKNLKYFTQQRESELMELEIEAERRKMEASAALGEERIQAIKNQMQAILDQGGSMDSPEYLQEQQALIAAQEALAQEYTDYYIAQSERRIAKDQEETKEKREAMKQWASTTQDFSNKFGKLMGAVADIKEQNIQQDFAQGKISEEQAEAEFERVKKMRIAELWMTTIAGAGGAFLNDMGNYPAPVNYILAAADFATAMAMGVAQTRQIKQQEFSSSAGGGGATSSGIEAVSVSPLLNETLDPMLATNLETSMNSYQDKEQRVFILESDIQASNRQVEVRQAETTF